MRPADCAQVADPRMMIVACVSNMFVAGFAASSVTVDLQSCINFPVYALRHTVCGTLPLRKVFHG